MADDLISQLARQYGATSNWNALRGSSDTLLKQFAQQYGADTNWNSFRPQGAPGGGSQSGGSQVLSNAPILTSQNTTTPGTTPQATGIQDPNKGGTISTTGNWGTQPVPAGWTRNPDGTISRSITTNTNTNLVPGAQFATGGQTAAQVPADLISQLAQQYGAGSNWNALRGQPGDLIQQFTQQYGADANWNSLRPTGAAATQTQTSAPTGTTTTPTTLVDRAGTTPPASTPNPSNPNFDYKFPGGTNPNIPSQNYADYLKALIDSGVSPEESKKTADSVFTKALQTAIDLANTNAYGGVKKHDDPSYWLDMWKKDPAYTWDRLIGKGAGTGDAAKYGPYAGGDPNAEGATSPGTTPPGTTNTANDMSMLASFLTDSPLLAPWTQPFNYADFTSSATYTPPPPFQAPTAAQLQEDPGYQSRLTEAQKAIERSAAAKGTLLGGGTLKDLEQFGQDYASNEYQGLYARKLNDYLTNYNANLTNFQTMYGRDMSDWTTNYSKSLGEYQQNYNIFEQNQAKQYNRLANLAGLGQTAAGQLSGAGVNVGGNIANTLLGGARGIGDYYTQIANALGAGQVGSSNAYSSLFQNLGNMANLYAILYGPKQQ